MGTIQTVLEVIFRGGSAQQQLRAFAAEGAAAAQKIDESFAKIPASLRAVDAIAGQVKGQLSGIASGLGPLSAGLEAVGGKAAFAAVGVGALVAVTVKGTAEAIAHARALVLEAQGVNLTTDAYQEYTFALAQFGITAEQTATFFGRLERSLGDVQTGTGALSRTLKIANPDMLELLKRTTDSEEGFRLLAKAIKDAPTDFLGVKIAVAAFGREADDLAGFIRDGAHSVDELRQKARDLGVVLDAESIAKAKEASIQFDNLSLVIKTHVTQGFLDLQEAINAIAIPDFLIRFFAHPTEPTTVEKLTIATTQLQERMQELRALAAKPTELFTPEDAARAHDLQGAIDSILDRRGFLQDLVDTQNAHAKAMRDAALAGLDLQNIESLLLETEKSRNDNLRDLTAAQQVLAEGVSPEDFPAAKKTRSRKLEFQEKLAALPDTVDFDQIRQAFKEDAFYAEENDRIDKLVAARRKAAQDAATAEKQYTDNSKQLAAQRAKAGLEGVALILAENANMYDKLAELAANAGVAFEVTEDDRANINAITNNKILAQQQDFQDKTDQLRQELEDQGSTAVDKVNRAANQEILAAHQDLNKKLLASDEQKQAAMASGSQETIDEITAIETKGYAQLAERELVINEKRAKDLEDARVRDAKELNRKLIEIGEDFIDSQPVIRNVGAFFGVSEDDLAKLFKGGQANAEEFAEMLSDTIGDAWKDVGDTGRNALRQLFRTGKIDAKSFVEDLKGIIFDALIDIASQQIILPIVAQLVGVTGLGGGEQAGGGGGGGGGLLQQGQQILSLGKTLKSGFDLLTGALGSSTVAVDGLTGAVGEVGSVFGSSVFAGTGALAPGVLSSAAIGVGPVTGALGSGVVAPGLVVDATTGTIITSGVGEASGSALAGGAGAASTTAGFGAMLAGAGIAAAAAAAVIGIIGTLEVSNALMKARDTFSTRDQGRVLAQSMIHDQPILNGLAELTTRLMSFGAIGGKQGGTAMFDLFQGNVSFGNIAGTTALLLANPLAPLIYLAANPSTGGTALRKRFEEWIENDEMGTGFFGRDSGTFKRGVGQTGLSATDVHGKDIQAKFRESIGQGARGIAKEEGIDFVEAQKVFIERQKEAIGLTDKQLKQVTGLGAAFRALQGKEVGEEETRTFGVIADFLGSIAVEGASAAETMDIVANATAALGRPAAVFEKLNEFFLSKDNDIQVETYRDAIQGLSAALFQDLPQGVDAAAIALDELNKAGNGLVTFEQIEKRVKGAILEAEALGPALKSAFAEGIAQSNIEDLKVNIEVAFDTTSAEAAIKRLDELEFDPVKFGDDLFDSITAGLKTSIAEAVFDGFIQGAFKGQVLGPFLETLNDTMTKVKAGDLTVEEGNVILGDAAKMARDNLESFRPLIEEAIAAGKSLAEVFEDAGDAAELAKARAEQVKAFNASIDRQILGFLSPNLAAQYDQEKTARERLHLARELGLDLNRVERLNALEREQLLKDQAEQTNDEIKKIHDRFIEDVIRAQDRIRDLLSSQLGSTASPLPPQQALANAQREFATLAAQARAGDLKALEKIPDAAKNVEDLARQLFGTTDKFFDIFNPLIATEQELANIDPASLPIPPGDQEIIDTLNEHQAEAVELFNQMIDLLELTAEGFEKPNADNTGTYNSSPSNPQPPDPSIATPVGSPNDAAGQYGLTAANQATIQSVVAGLAPGGDTHQALVQLMGLPSLTDIASLSGGSLAQRIAVQVLQLFPGIRTIDGFRKVLSALDYKIYNPSTYSPVLGYASGGVVGHDQLIRVGEGDQPELILPFARGRRSMEAQAAFESLVLREGIAGFAEGGVVGAQRELVSLLRLLNDGGSTRSVFVEKLVVQSATVGTISGFNINETLIRMMQQLLASGRMDQISPTPPARAGITTRRSDVSAPTPPTPPGQGPGHWEQDVHHITQDNEFGMFWVPDPPLPPAPVVQHIQPNNTFANNGTIVNGQWIPPWMTQTPGTLIPADPNFGKKPTQTDPEWVWHPPPPSNLPPIHYPKPSPPIFGGGGGPMWGRPTGPTSIVVSERSADDVSASNDRNLNALRTSLAAIQQEVNMSSQRNVDELRKLQAHTEALEAELVRIRVQLRQRLSLPT